MEECVRCNEVDEDRRTLWMACFYQMNELELPFEKQIITDKEDRKHNFFTLRVCKRCRADWMEAIRDWFNTPIGPESSCGSGIYVRRFGDTVEVTEEEFREKYG